jgi:hypothetical protein
LSNSRRKKECPKDNTKWADREEYWVHMVTFRFVTHIGMYLLLPGIC